MTEPLREVAYYLVIEGLADGWVSDHTGDVLLGSGSNSWIGQYEQDATYIAHETVGNRVVRAGLKIPNQIQKGRLSPKGGRLESTMLTLEIVDVDDIFPTLFASEGKTFDVLGAHEAPGTSALSATITIEGGDTIDPADRYLGIERIGPARERAWFYPFPFQGIGHHHQVAQNAQASTNAPPPIRVSTEPLEFTGRKVALYKLFRNDADIAAGVSDWDHWGDQYALGPPEFVGVMRDGGEYTGDRTWRINCFGMESLTRRRMGTFDQGWTTIASAPISLSDAQRGFAVNFQTVSVGGNVSNYGSTFFGTDTLSASGSKIDYVNEIGGFIQDVGDGTTTADFGIAAGNMLDEDFGSGDIITAALTANNFQIKRPGDPNSTDALVVCSWVAHEKVWRALGYEPALQAVTWADAPSSSLEIVFSSLDEGDIYADPTPGEFGGLDGTEAPGPGYWVGRFHTSSLGFAPQLITGDEMSNKGQPRVYTPLYSAQPIILPSPANDQTLQLNASFPYIESDPTVDATLDAGRYFVFRGQRAVGDVTQQGQIFSTSGELVEDLEAEPFAAVAEVQWNLNGAQYGTVDDNPGPQLTISRWVSSRMFGVDHDQMKFAGEWSALAAGEYSIECAPLHSYAYRENPQADGVPYERAWAVLGQLWLSTGTASGWSGGVYSDGDNAPTTTDETFWCSDITTSELGLGIPFQLVASPAELLESFDEVEGGAHGGLQQVRYSYSEPFQSQDLIDSILKTRGLSMSLRGGVFGVVRLGLFNPTDVDAVITDQSIAVPPNDPSAEPTTQSVRATGGIDVVALSATKDPATGEFVFEDTYSARDPGARFRRGDIEESIEDPGLRPHSWAGVGPWLGDFRRLHTIERATWASKRHFMIKTTLTRVAGEYLWPGARVSFTNERVYTAAGVLGVVGALGHVMSVTARPRLGVYDVEILIYADQTRLPIFAPIGRVASISGATVTLVADADFLDHGAGSDAERFTRPSWLAEGTAATVGLLEYHRDQWTLLAVSDTVASASGDVVTLDTGFGSGLHTNRDYYLVMVTYDDQASGSWPRAALLPYVLDTLDFGTVPTDGFPYIEG